MSFKALILVGVLNYTSILIWIDDANNNNVDPSTMVRLIYVDEFPVVIKSYR